jgi:hypothetical protein
MAAKKKSVAAKKAKKAKAGKKSRAASKGFLWPKPKGPCDHVVRGYFGLGDHEHVVHVTSNEDFLLYIWARNVETSQGGVQILTPPSQFRTSGSSGPHDGLVLDVPAQTGMTLGCIGAQGGEVIDLSNAFGARVTVFLTVVTAHGATVTMTGA